MAAWHLLVFDPQHRPFQKNYSKWYHNHVNLFEKWSLFNLEIWRTNLFCAPVPSPISGAMQLGFSYKQSGLKNSWWLFIYTATESNYASFKPYADILKNPPFSNTKLAPWCLICMLNSSGDQYFKYRILQRTHRNAGLWKIRFLGNVQVICAVTALS